MPSSQKQSQTSQPLPISQSLANLLGYYIGGDTLTQFQNPKQPLNAPIYSTQPTTQPTSYYGGGGNTGGLPSVNPITGLPITGTGGVPLNQPTSYPTTILRNTGVEGAQAGYIPGTILPNYQDMLAQSGQTFFGSLDPGVFTGADLTDPTNYDYLSQRAFGMMGTDPMASFNNLSGQFSGISAPQASAYTTGLGQGGRVDLPYNIISDAQTQQAIEGLLNPPSVFDMMSGGPIVDEIQARTNAMQDAYRTQQMSNLSEGLERTTAGLANEGVLSGSDVLNARNDLTQGVLRDVAVFEAGMGLENTRYLGGLAMEDIRNGSDNLRTVLTQSMIQRGMNVDFAMAEADRISREIMAKADLATQTNIANMQAANALAMQKIQSGTQLALGQQQQGVDLLRLGAQDYTGGLERNLGVQQLPLTLASGLVGNPVISKGSSSSKSL